MKRFELLKTCAELLKTLHGYGIRIDDYKYVKLYEEYRRMRQDGEKTTYAVALLAERYHISERKVYKLIKHYTSDCKNDAVG